MVKAGKMMWKAIVNPNWIRDSVNTSRVMAFDPGAMMKLVLARYARRTGSRAHRIPACGLGGPFRTTHGRSPWPGAAAGWTAGQLGYHAAAAAAFSVSLRSRVSRL